MPEIKKLQFASGVDVTAPTDLTSTSSTVAISVYVDDAAFVTANGTAQDGDVYFNSTLNRLRFYVGGSWRTGAVQPVSLTAEVSGVLPIANGGSGQTTANSALNAFLPAQASNAGKFLKTDGTNASWDLSALASYADDAAFVTANGTATNGDMYINTTSNRVRVYISGSWQSLAVLPVSLTSEVSGTLPIANGGTGETSASAAINALVPTQSGNAGKFLTTNGSVVSWDTVGAGGTATPTVAGQTTSYFPLVQSSVLASSSATINITTTDGYQLVRATNAGSQTINLPAAASNTGRVLTIVKQDDAGALTIDANSTELIGQSQTCILENAQSSLVILCNGTSWEIISLHSGVGSFVRLRNPVGFGSTALAVRRYNDFVGSAGSAISYSTTAAEGTVFTINQNGVYTISATDNFSGASEQLGFTRNASVGIRSTNMLGISVVNGLLNATSISSADAVGTVSWTGHLTAGDTIRVQAVQGSSNGSLSYVANVTIVQLMAINP